MTLTISQPFAGDPWMFEHMTPQGVARSYGHLGPDPLYIEHVGILPIYYHEPTQHFAAHSPCSWVITDEATGQAIAALIEKAIMRCRELDYARGHGMAVAKRTATIARKFAQPAPPVKDPVLDERERDLGDRVHLGGLRGESIGLGSVTFSSKFDCFVLTGTTAYRDDGYMAKAMREVVEAVLRVDAQRRSAGITHADEIKQRWASSR